ncbi:MAG: dUTP diphosphatase [Prevotella sp.]|nr:dUTP diphosphatase [Prevotella sp.]
MTKIDIKYLNTLATLPTKGSEYAAGCDLYAALDQTTEIQPHQTVKIGTGIAVSLPENTFGAIFARSGLATKQGLRPANCCGIVDADYRGELVVALHNDSNEIRKVNPGDRIAQLIVIPFVPIEFSVVDELDDTVRGTGGFGSTGV